MNPDERCQMHRSGGCHNKPYRIVDVAFQGRVLSSYRVCRKHYGWLVRDGKVPA